MIRKRKALLGPPLRSRCWGEFLCTQHLSGRRLDVEVHVIVVMRLVHGVSEVSTHGCVCNDGNRGKHAGFDDHELVSLDESFEFVCVHFGSPLVGGSL